MKSIFERSIIKTLLTVLIATSLANCSSQPRKPDNEVPALQIVSPLERAQKLITSAQLSSEPEQSRLRLLAADILLKANETDLAAHQINKIFPEYLPPALFAKWSIVKSNIALSEGDIELARTLVINPTIEESILLLTTDDIIELRQLRAQYYFNEENYSASVNERILLNELLIQQRLQRLLEAGLDDRPITHPQTANNQLQQSEGPLSSEEREDSQKLQYNEKQLHNEKQALGKNQRSLREHIQPLDNETQRFNTLIQHFDSQILKNENRLWHTLMEIPAQNLNNLIQMNTSNAELNNTPLKQHGLNLNNSILRQAQPNHLNQYNNQANGWYSLALINKNNQTNIEQQLAAVNQWQTLWLNHPANLRLPADLQLLAEIATQQPQKIAVLLPLSGKLTMLSSVLRDGLMAAFYERSQSAQQLPELVFYDTEQENISLIYDRAVEQGAQLIIGPLQKKNITELALKLELAAPILALNRIDTQIETAAGLYQFGLAVEDEIDQIATQARLDGHKRALVIAPRGAWGDRNINAFMPAWEKLEGEIAYSYRYTGNGDYSNVIKEALHIDRSQTRATDIQRIVGKIGKEARRRSDIDMIFMAANTNQARQIKPTLAFYFADDIPVYTCGSIYTGIQDPKLNRDLNDIQFTSLPWFFEYESQMKKTIGSYGSQQASYQKLYALGIDAFHIYPRLRQLESVNQAQFYGYTGTLKLNQQRKIVREQQWAKFINGLAAPLNKSH